MGMAPGSDATGTNAFAGASAMLWLVSVIGRHRDRQPEHAPAMLEASEASRRAEFADSLPCQPRSEVSLLAAYRAGKMWISLYKTNCP